MMNTPQETDPAQRKVCGMWPGKRSIGMKEKEKKSENLYRAPPLWQGKALKALDNVHDKFNTLDIENHFKSYTIKLTQF